MSEEIYADMSYGACKKRYDEGRQRIFDAIARGGVSASMSGIEWCQESWDDTKPESWLDLSVALTWDGQRHIKRDWRAMLDEMHPLSPKRPSR